MEAASSLMVAFREAVISERGAMSHTLPLSINPRICSTRHAVIRGPSLTGFGNVPAFTFRHSVADENGNMVGMS
jgi:hypothetical protein